MTVLFMDSHLGRSPVRKYDDVGQLGTITATTGRHAGDGNVNNYEGSQTNADNARMQVGVASLTSVAFAFAWKQTGGLLENRRMAQVYNDSGDRVCEINEVRNSTVVNLRINGTVVATWTEPAQDVWQHVGVVLETGSPGTWTVYVDGTLLATDAATVTGTIEEVQLSTAREVWIGGHRIAFQDFWITDGEWLGDCRVLRIAPSAAGAAEAWTPLSETVNANEINSAPIDEAKWVATAAAAIRDSHAMDALPADATRTLFPAVQSTLVTQSTDSGPYSVSHGVRLDTTYYDTAPIVIGQPLEGLRHLWQTNPATAADWARAEIESAEFGYVSA